MVNPTIVPSGHLCDCRLALKILYGVVLPENRNKGKQNN